jgi:hypothetical protein
MPPSDVFTEGGTSTDPGEGYTLNLNSTTFRSRITLSGDILYPCQEATVLCNRSTNLEPVPGGVGELQLGELLLTGSSSTGTS